MNFQKKCLDRMMEYKKKGATIIFVSHSMEDVKRICERVMWIENHKVKEIGSPDEVLIKYSGLA